MYVWGAEVLFFFFLSIFNPPPRSSPLSPTHLELVSEMRRLVKVSGSTGQVTYICEGFNFSISLSFLCREDAGFPGPLSASHTLALCTPLPALLAPCRPLSLRLYPFHQPGRKSCSNLRSSHKSSYSGERQRISLIYHITGEYI